jgi:hypothetical protein
MHIKLIAERLQDRDVTVSLDHTAIDFVLQQAYDPIYGARPLRRYLEKNLVTMLSRKIFEGVIPNHSHVTISADEEFNTLRLSVTKYPINSSGVSSSVKPSSSSTSKFLNKKQLPHSHTKGRKAYSMIDANNDGDDDGDYMQSDDP